MRAAFNKIKSSFDGLPMAVPAAAFVLLLLFQNFSMLPSTLPLASRFDRIEMRLLDDHYVLQTDLDYDLAQLVALKPTVFVLPVNPALLMSSPYRLQPLAQDDLTQIETALHNVPIELVTDLFPVWMTGASAAEGGAMPCPSSAAAYTQFLRNYGATYATLVSRIHVIAVDAESERRWQTYFPIQVGYGSCGETSFSEAERKKISEDLAERRGASSKHVASGI